MMDTKQPLTHLPQIFNTFGEAPLPDAPSVTLTNGVQAVPQQFFHYQRSVENVEEILSHISFSDDFPLFTFSENGHVFIQVGIIGHENYPPIPAARPAKIVYGRKWFIEPYTPTSEVIQTAYLAINKAREHEIRELLTVTTTMRGRHRRSTPFNTHMDLPLAAANTELFERSEEPFNAFNIENVLREQFKRIALGCYDIILEEAALIHKPYWLVAVRFRKKEASSDTTKDVVAHYFPELLNQTVYFVTQAHGMSCLLHALVSAILKKCEEHVAEHFLFDGFARFSRSIHPDDWAQFSLSTRIIDEPRSEVFEQQFRTMAALVDGGKAPMNAQAVSLANKQQRAMTQHDALEGYLPR